MSECQRRLRDLCWKRRAATPETAYSCIWRALYPRWASLSCRVLRLIWPGWTNPSHSRIWMIWATLRLGTSRLSKIACSRMWAGTASPAWQRPFPFGFNPLKPSALYWFKYRRMVRSDKPVWAQIWAFICEALAESIPSASNGDKSCMRSAAMASAFLWSLKLIPP